jgi:hypothetical protein
VANSLTVCLSACLSGVERGGEREREREREKEQGSLIEDIMRKDKLEKKQR